ncbi:MAG: hypothetical protein ABW066_10580, partial [Sedimenticola sp.]
CNGIEKPTSTLLHDRTPNNSIFFSKIDNIAGRYSWDFKARTDDNPGGRPNHDFIAALKD